MHCTDEKTNKCHPKKYFANQRLMSGKKHDDRPKNTLKSKTREN